MKNNSRLYFYLVSRSTYWTFYWYVAPTIINKCNSIMVYFGALSVLKSGLEEACASATY